MNYIQAKRVVAGTVIYHRYIVGCKAVALGEVEGDTSRLKHGWRIPVSGVETTYRVGGNYFISGKMGYLWSLEKPEHFLG